MLFFRKKTLLNGMLLTLSFLEGAVNPELFLRGAGSPWLARAGLVVRGHCRQLSTRRIVPVWFRQPGKALTPCTPLCTTRHLAGPGLEPWPCHLPGGFAATVPLVKNILVPPTQLPDWRQSWRGDAQDWGMHRAGGCTELGECAELGGDAQGWEGAQSQEDALVQELLLVSPGARRVGACPAPCLHSPTR